MRTLTEVQGEYKNLLKELTEGLKLVGTDATNFEAHIKNNNRIRKKMDFIRPVLKYLETSPHEDFIREQLSEVENKMENRVEGFKKMVEAMDKPPSQQLESKMRAQFYKEQDMSKLRLQQKTMHYILGNSNINAPGVL